MRQWSLWEKEVLFEGLDILVIGAGLNGLFSALYARKKYPKAHIMVVDRSPLPYGASTRNAGFACFGSVSEILSDIEQLGRQKAIQLVEKRYEGLEMLKSSVPLEAIDWREEGGWEWFEDQNMINFCKEQIEGLNLLLLSIDKNLFRTGLSTTFLAHMPPQEIIYTEKEAQLHPAKLVKHLISELHKHNIHFQGGLEVKNIEKQGDEMLIHSENLTFRVPKVVVCTNALSPHLLPHLNLVAQRGQIIVSQAFDKKPFLGNIHAHEGFYYARCTSDHRILIGGARHLDFKSEETHEMAENPKLTQALKDFAERYLLHEQKFEIAYQWSGIMGFGSGKEKDYIVGKQGNIHYAVRMGGMGVALSTLSALECIKDL